MNDRATKHILNGEYSSAPIDSVILAHDERHLRRKMLTLASGQNLLIDLPQAISLQHGDALVKENGDLIEIIAANQQLHKITAMDKVHLSRLCWHLGNRHLPAQIEEDCIYIQRDHVIHDMLIGLGAKIINIDAPFSPEKGAYHSHATQQHHHEQHDGE